MGRELGKLKYTHCAPGADFHVARARWRRFITRAPAWLYVGSVADEQFNIVILQFFILSDFFAFAECLGLWNAI